MSKPRFNPSERARLGALCCALGASILTAELWTMFAGRGVFIDVPALWLVWHGMGLRNRTTAPAPSAAIPWFAGAYAAWISLSLVNAPALPFAVPLALVVGIIVLAAGLLVTYLVFRRRAALRPVDACPTCDYDLFASTDRCPECGTPIAAPTTALIAARLGEMSPTPPHPPTI